MPLMPGRSARFAPKTRPLEWLGLGVAMAGAVLLVLGSQGDHHALFGVGAILFITGACIVAACKLYSRWIALRAASRWLSGEIEQRQETDRDPSRPL